MSVVILCLKSSACPLCFIVFVEFRVSAGILVFNEFCISSVFCVCVCVCVWMCFVCMLSFLCFMNSVYPLLIAVP